MPESLVIGLVQGGGCPHTAVRVKISSNESLCG